MNKATKKQYKAHKIYRWIALFIKLITLSLLQFAFISLQREVKLPISGSTSTLGAFLALFISLIIYYAIIFICNRNFNFHEKTDLKKAIAVYILVVLILFTVEVLYANPLKNLLYSLTHLGLKDGYTVISLASVKQPIVFLLISLFVTLMFSFIAKYVTFTLFKKVLTKQKVLDRI